MSLYQRGDTWWISLVHNGQRIRQSARTSSKREAQRQHDELKARLWQQRLTGATLAVLRELGGWSSMDMVNRYAHLAPDHVQAWANNAAPRAVTKTVTRRRRV